MQKTVERYDVNKGLNLVASEIARSPRFASSMRNAQYRDNNGLEKRKGFQLHAPSAGGAGAFTYRRANVTTGVITPEALCVDNNLRKLLFSQLTVTYTGSEPSAIINLIFDPDDDEYKCTITAGTTEVLNQGLGKGYDETSPYTIDQLRAAIDALADFTASVTGATTTPAAFIKIIRDYQLTEEPWIGKAAYWSAIRSSITDPFSTKWSHVHDEDFENVSFSQLNNVVFITDGYQSMMKYDGVSLYRAGIPKPASLATALGAAGAVTGNNYFHRAIYAQKDAVGNVVEGNYLQASAGLNATADRMDVTVANIQNTTGFNTNCAIVAGAQVGVNTITVDNGSGGSHSMQIGDTAYFFDSISASYVEREVTGITGSTIVVAGAAVTVADNAVISANLRILILRNKTSSITTPSQFYIVAEIPNNSYAATQVYDDNLADASLGALYEFSTIDRSPPPKGKYLTVHQKLLFLAGDLESPYQISWSDVEGPEYWDLAINADEVQSSRGDKITGISPNGDFLAIGCEETIQIGAGTFGDQSYRITERAAFVGVSGHHSMSQAEGILVWWSQRGPYTMTNGQLPQPLGIGDEQGKSGRLEPVMTMNLKVNTQAFRDQFLWAKRCVAFNWSDQNKVLFFLPAESDTGGLRSTNDNSVVYAYDYSKDAWLEWDNLDLIGGMIQVEEEIYFIGKRYSDFSSAIRSELKRFHNLEDAHDYEDNDAPIYWEHGSPWEAQGGPSLLKNYIEITIKSIDDLSNNDFAVTVDQEFNYLKGAVIASFDMSIVASGYGDTGYGVDQYGDPGNPSTKHDLNRSKCTSTRVNFKNEEHQKNVIINGWEILYAADYRPGFKK